MKQASGKVHHVTAADRGQTLSAFLRTKLGGVPWSRVQKMVRSRHVMIHGNICTDEARRLKEGEVVKVLEAAAPRRRQVQPTLDEMMPDVISRFLAAKAGRPARGKRVAGKPEPQKPRRPGPVYPVHRIDRETSGLVVFARTVPAGRILAEQFRLHATHRRYLALAVGRVGAGTIVTHLVRDRGDGRRGSSETGEGKRAVTHVMPLEHFGDDYTFVECRLETGRTHQIRIHLSEIGHPLCGERVYAGPRGGKAADRSGATRVILHAAELGFVHPQTGAELRFESPLPADIEKLLAALRKESRP
jgi:23S rRNA pseudouridine1911/1915/1917 synthase